MNMMKTGLVATALLAVAACGNAEASELDASNPMHCVLVLQVYKLTAEADGRAIESRTFAEASKWYGRRAAHLPENERSVEAISDLEKRVLASEDAGIAVAKECLTRRYAALQRDR